MAVLLLYFLTLLASGVLGYRFGRWGRSQDEAPQRERLALLQAREHAAHLPGRAGEDTQ
jgi:hypothetical protein